MPLTEIFQLRKCGIIQFHTIYEYPGNLNRILGYCGLKPNAEKLISMNYEQAVATITRWLHREPAYDSELMRREQAEHLASEFIKKFSDSTSKFYSNARWFEKSVPQWERFTDCVFDGGVLIENGIGNATCHICLWFVDSD